MSVAIWKFQLLPAADGRPLMIPRNARLLHVASDPSGDPCVWAVVDPSAPAVERWIDVRMTGQTFDLSPCEVYVGTFQTRGGIVGHVFDLNPPHPLTPSPDRP